MADENNKGESVKCILPINEGRLLEWFDDAFRQADTLELSERERVYKWVLSKVVHQMKKEGVHVHVKA